MWGGVGWGGAGRVLLCIKAGFGLSLLLLSLQELQAHTPGPAALLGHIKKSDWASPGELRT